MARVYQINVKPKSSDGVGIPKTPVNTAQVSKDNVGDDHNNYRTTSKNSTPNRAVLLHTKEKIEELHKEGWKVKPGHLGENITMEGIDYDSLDVGTQVMIGDVKVEVSEPCHPCTVLGNLPYIGKERVNEFIKTMKGRRGWYAKVIEEGMIAVGDEISIVKT